MTLKKKRGLKIFSGILVFFIILHAVLVYTGNVYVYKALLFNYVDIDDYSIFYERKIAADDPIPLAVASSYNKRTLPKNMMDTLQHYRSVAFLVIQNDSIMWEQYWEGYSDTSISNSFSMAKSIVSVLVGMALDEGSIQSLDQPVSDFIPALKNDERNNITIRHLLMMSSGLEWDEEYQSLFSKTTKAYYGTNLPELATSLKAVRPPGEIWEYVSGNTQLLAMVLKQATGKTLSEFASEKLWTPLHAMHDAEWSLDHKNGNEKAYCCYYSNARDFARIGLLYLHNGNWHGKQLLSSAYIKESLTPVMLDNGNGRKTDYYGYHWWLMEYKGQHIFYARGILGQYIIVIPGLNLVAVRLGHERGVRLENFHVSDVVSYIDGIIEVFGN